MLRNHRSWLHLSFGTQSMRNNVLQHANYFCSWEQRLRDSGNKEENTLSLHELVKKCEHKAKLHFCRDCWGLLSLRRLLLRTVREKRRKVINRYPTFALAQVKPADSTACLESRNYWS